MFKIIAAVGKNWEIGEKGELIFHLKEDMRFFKETTMGHAVVMGRKTWESLPKKLPGRTNIVVASQPVEGADETVSDLAEFVARHRASEEVFFVIGGEKLYRAMLPEAETIYLTEIDADAPQADRFFPKFDVGMYDKKVLRGGKEGEIGYQIVEYRRKDGKAKKMV